MNKCHIDGEVDQRNADVTPKWYYALRKLTLFLEWLHFHIDN